MKKKFGFSLIELMAVIAIIGILASIAMPSYRNYIIKSRIGSAMAISNLIDKIFINNYEQNATFSVSDNILIVPGGPITGIITNQNLIVNVGPIAQMWWKGDNIRGKYCMYLHGLSGIPNYTAPSTTIQGNIGNAAGFCKQITYDNGIYKIKCGDLGVIGYPGNAVSIPIKYLPKGCTCSNIDNTDCT